jgi:hypothetical protein
MHPNLTVDVKRKKRQDTFKKYGVEHTTMLDSVKDKSAKSIFKKHGVSHYSMTTESKDKAAIRNLVIKDTTNSEFLKRIEGINTIDYSRVDLAILLNIPFSTLCVRVRELSIPIKPCIYGTSAIELSVIEYIESLGITDSILNTRSLLDGKEIDIYIPSHNIAIEIDGIYWHSEEYGKDSSYHLNKTVGCKNKNINLLHIFDIEWTNSIKQNIWKSMISSRLKLNKRIYARKCEIREISTTEATIFFNNNHLQGFHGGKIKIGLFHDNILVQAIIIGNTRYNNNYKYELIRAATLNFYNIVGGLSKLLKRVTGSIISYADRRYADGNGYTAIGMKLDSISTPNYYYIVNGTLESRLKYQKHKLMNILPIFDKNKTEYENMELNNYYRIWDCGNLVFSRST